MGAYIDNCQEFCDLLTHVIYAQQERVQRILSEKMPGHTPEARDTLHHLHQTLTEYLLFNEHVGAKQYGYMFLMFLEASRRSNVSITDIVEGAKEELERLNKL